MTSTYNNYNDDYIITDNKQLNNLPIDITTLIIRCTPTQDLTNLPTTLKYVFFREEAIFFDEYEIDDMDENNAEYDMGKNDVEYDINENNAEYDNIYDNDTYNINDLTTESINEQYDNSSIKNCRMTFNNVNRYTTNNSSYFNYAQLYKYHDTIPSLGINTYSFALNPEPIINTFKLKVPFGCKIYNYRNLMVNPNGYFKVKSY